LTYPSTQPCWSSSPWSTGTAFCRNQLAGCASS